MSMTPARHHVPPPSLEARRTMLLARIALAREETAVIGRRLTVDLQVADRSRRSALAGVKVLKASAVAAGLVWSWNASSTMGRSSRLVTLAVSFLSTLRAIRGVAGLFAPVTSSTSRNMS